MSSPSASPSVQFTVRSIRRVVHTHKWMYIEIGDVLGIVSILSVFCNAFHLGPSDPANSPVAWGILNASFAGLAAVAGLQRNPVMIIPYMVTLVINITTALATLIYALYKILSQSSSIDTDFECELYPDTPLSTSSTTQSQSFTWISVGRLSLVIIINVIFYCVCHTARGAFRNERCRKECCVLPYRSPQISPRNKSSRSNSYDSAYETGRLCMAGRNILRIIERKNRSCALSWEINKDSIVKEKTFSSEFEAVEMTWRLGLFKVKDQLKFCLSLREGDYSIHSADVSMEYKMINHTNYAKSISGESVSTHNMRSLFWNRPQFFDWQAIMGENEGFIKDGSFTFEVQFSLLNEKGFRKLRRFDFTDPNEPHHDVTFVIDGVKIYANRGALSSRSPVFKTMFFGEFKEKNEKEIELKDVKSEEFLELLNLLVSPLKHITDRNYKYLLPLADRFEIMDVMEKIEYFLIQQKYSKSSLMAYIHSNLVLADRYQLFKLQDHCLDQLSTWEEAEEIMKLCKGFDIFSDDFHIICLEKIIKLVVTKK